MSKFQHLDILLDVVDNATFPNRMVKRAAREFVSSLKKDLILAGYEDCADDVTKAGEIFTEAVDLYFEQEAQKKRERIEKASIAEDDNT